MTAAGLEPYDVAARTGELKNVIVTLSPDREAMVRFVLRSADRLDALRAAVPGLLDDLAARGTPAAVVSANLLPEHVALPEGDEETLGEVWIRGENVMKGYWGKPEATAQAITEDGWFRSGDLARRDAAGNYYIVDRTKDMILRGGLNVYPREIEEVLYEHPAVAEAAVVGVPHPELGQEVAAHVVLAPGAHATEEELIQHVKSQVAPYKYPRTVSVRDGLPKTATGKILKRELTPTE